MPAVEICQDKWRFGSFKVLTNSEDRVNTESKKLIMYLSGAKPLKTLMVMILMVMSCGAGI